MPDLLVELFSEEIPARMQARAADDLKRLVTDALVTAGFLYEGAQAHATPRRLALAVVGLPARGKDVREDRKGPRVGAPEAALAGFLKSVGLLPDQLKVESDPKKGDFYVARVERPGRPTAEFVAEMMPGLIRDFPWPKSMRWGAASRAPGSLRWVRPLHSILCTFGGDAEAPEVVSFEIDGIVSGDTTRGHRFMAPAPITVRRFDEYEAALHDARVVLDAERRRDIIRHDARDLAFAQSLELVDDEALLAEVAGLVDWPVTMLGRFDRSYLEMPPEVIRTTIRTNQKCFVLRSTSPGERGEEGALANAFILVSNLEAADGGAAIVAGNERVVRARLSDAKFFWDTDRKTPLEDRLPRLDNIVFHEKLGTQGERVQRIAALARELAPLVGADPDLAERAARLAKADLVTEMVGEFPELQGLMGRYYAAAQGEHPSVAAAVEEHYKPLGPSDRVPADPVSVAVALADKLDTLVGFWAIDEKPTGSKDPFALRRAALGVIRLVLENGVRMALLTVMAGLDPTTPPHAAAALDGRVKPDHDMRLDLLAFFYDRLKVYLRERGARHDLIDAVLAAEASHQPHAEVPGEAGPRSTHGAGASTSPPSRLPATAPQDEVEGGGQSTSNDDLLMIVRRVEALGRFLDTEDGANLVAGFKRAANILRIEEKKDGRAYDGLPDMAALVADEERALATALARASGAASEAVAGEDFEGTMRALAELRPAVDAFFDKVTVNVDDPALRENRLRLLNTLRRATREVADFARLEG